MAENQVQNPPAEKVITLSASLLESFQGHPFRVASGEEMEQLKESIREYGVLSPLLVRPRGDGRYEIVSGYRRKAACEALGIIELPVLVRNMTDDEAVILMVDSNIQREHILPSEKAFAYKMKMEAIRRQAGRPNKNSRQVVGNIESADIIGQAVNESGRTVQRYIRLTHLIPSILQMVDDYQIAFNPAVEISYLTEEHQRMLKEEMDACQATPSLTQSRKSICSAQVSSTRWCLPAIPANRCASSMISFSVSSAKPRPSILVCVLRYRSTKLMIHLWV